MRAVDAYRGAVKALNRYAKEEPNRTIRIDGDTLQLSEILKELGKVIAWIHPELSTENLVPVVRCKNCKNYKSYRKKDVYKAVAIKKCCLDRVRHTPEYFCSEGEEV